jgi:hypothetical protein
VTGKNRPMPKGQLQADARTLIAAAHYLFRAEPGLATKPARLDEAPATVAEPRKRGRSKCPPARPTRCKRASSVRPIRPPRRDSRPRLMRRHALKSPPRWHRPSRACRRVSRRLRAR